MCGALAFGWRGPVDAWQQARRHVPHQRARGQRTRPLPGVSVLVKSAGAVKAASSTDPDGTYRGFALRERLRRDSGTHRLHVPSRDRSPSAGTCDQTVDFQLSLAPRTTGCLGARTPSTTSVVQRKVRAARRRNRRPATPSPAAGGRGQRFETLNVQTQAAAAAGVETTDAGDAAARLLLPPGFSSEGPTEAVAINGNMASLDRGMMNDRLDAIGRGEFNPATGEFGQGFGPGGRGFGGGQGFGGQGGRGGPGGGRAGRTRADPVDRAVDAEISCSAGAAADRTRTTCSRTTRSADRRSTARRTSCAPVRRRSSSRIDDRDSASRLVVRFESPGIYKGDRRTNFTASYSGNRGGDLFDQYATVPTAAMRAGDFSVDRDAADRSGHRSAVSRQSDSGRRASVPGRSRCCASSRSRISTARAATSTTSRPTRRRPTT